MAAVSKPCGGATQLQTITEGGTLNDDERHSGMETEASPGKLAPPTAQHAISPFDAVSLPSTFSSQASTHAAGSTIFAEEAVHQFDPVLLHFVS